MKDGMGGCAYTEIDGWVLLRTMEFAWLVVQTESLLAEGPKEHRVSLTLLMYVDCSFLARDSARAVCVLEHKCGRFYPCITTDDAISLAPAAGALRKTRA
jgi:hypothetical protein